MKKFLLISVLSMLPASLMAQPVLKTIEGPRDEPSYSALKPYWIERPVIEIIGRANMEFDTNRVTMNFAIQEINSDSDVALDKVTKRAKPAIDKVQALIGKNGRIEVNYTKTAIYQQYKDKEGNKIDNIREDKVENYVAVWNIRIETNDVNLVPRIKAELLAAGNSKMVGQAYYSFVPTNVQQRQIFAAAVEDAKDRAKIFAEGQGIKLRLLVAQEGRSECLGNSTGYGYAPAPAPPPPPAPVMAMDNNMVKLSGAKTILEANNLIMPASPAKQTLNSSVCMIYAIEK